MIVIERVTVISKNVRHFPYFTILNSTEIFEKKESSDGLPVIVEALVLEDSVAEKRGKLHSLVARLKSVQSSETVRKLIIRSRLTGCLLRSVLMYYGTRVSEAWCHKKS